MYYRIVFRARPGDVYLFELKKDKPQVLDVIHRVKEQFKIIHSTIKVFDGKVELSHQDFIHSGKTYIVRRVPRLDDKRCKKTVMEHTGRELLLKKH